MSFELPDATLPVADDMRLAMRTVWETSAQPGSFFTGAERIRLAAVARGEVAATTPAERAAEQIYREAWTIDAVYVDALVDDGLSREAYVEVMSVAVKVAAVDTAVVGLGASVEPLPEPVAGDPRGAVDPEAKQRSAFVPTVGAAYPPSMLSAIPGEFDRQHALSTGLYMSYEQMADFARTGPDLSRAQMELVAATTSLVNECFW